MPSWKRCDARCPRFRTRTAKWEVKSEKRLILARLLPFFLAQRAFPAASVARGVFMTESEMQNLAAELLNKKSYREAAQLFSDAIAEKGENCSLWNDWR